MEICSLCQGRQTDLYCGDERILRCRHCGLVFLRASAKAKTPVNYYEEGDFWVDVLADSELVGLAERNAKAVLKIILRHAGEGIGKKILDIGTHDGLFIKEAAGLGFYASGLEPNKKIAARAREHGLAVRTGDLENFDTKDRFDVVTLFHVLEHLNNPREAVLKIKKLLKNNGLFVLEVPNIESFPAGSHGLFWKFIALEHFFYFSPKTLTNLLQNNGFEILKVKKRNAEIILLDLIKILAYFFPSLHEKRDRLALKKPKNGLGSAFSFQKSFLHTLVTKIGIKKFLATIVHFLGREDHILIIARLKN